MCWFSSSTNILSKCGISTTHVTIIINHYVEIIKRDNDQIEFPHPISNLDDYIVRHTQTSWAWKFIALILREHSLTLGRIGLIIHLAMKSGEAPVSIISKYNCH